MNENEISIRRVRRENTKKIKKEKKMKCSSRFENTYLSLYGVRYGCDGDNVMLYMTTIIRINLQIFEILLNCFSCK